MPADFSRLVISQLSEKVHSDFSRLRISFGEIKCSSTPRRIILLVDGLSDLADDFVEERKGPPSSQAFKNGVPTQAAIGFANRCGLSPEELEIRNTPKGAFVFAKIIESGKPVFQLLRELAPKWISEIQGRRFMRWGTGDRRFTRPVRWVVSLLDERLVPFSFDGCDPSICSGSISKGHRLYKNSLTITSATEYSSILENAGVAIHRSTRKNLIKKLIEEESVKLQSFPDLSHSLLNELTDLVESPSLIIGEFESRFLDLPPEVLTTVMKVHQRYVPLFLEEDLLKDPLSFDSRNTLAPLFLCISNGLNKASNSIKIGNERVLKARLSDAEFFVKADLSVSSEVRREKLSGVAFAEGLGSLLDRVTRIEWIVSFLSEKIISPNINIENLKRAAYFCKHDLVSQMVGEFPELEGIIGGKYLLKEGESREVALAVSEQYLPRGSADCLPESESGSILALAERFELLFSIFSKGQRPSGSSDPYALRRAGNGILQILWSNNWCFDINKFINHSIKYWSELLPDFNINCVEVLLDLQEFFRQRIISLLEDQGIDSDLVQSVAGETISSSALLSDPLDIRLRADLLLKMRGNGQLSAIQAVVNRASRLADNSTLPTNKYCPSELVKPELFEKECEFEMLKVVNFLEPIVNSSSVDRYVNLSKGLVASAEALSQFFDGDQSVMVMADDLEIRTNRLNLLGILRNQASILADFSQIIVKEY